MREGRGPNRAPSTASDAKWLGMIGKLAGDRDVGRVGFDSSRGWCYPDSRVLCGPYVRAGREFISY